MEVNCCQKLLKLQPNSFWWDATLSFSPPLFFFLSFNFSCVTLHNVAQISQLSPICFCSVILLIYLFICLFSCLPGCVVWCPPCWEIFLIKSKLQIRLQNECCPWTPEHWCSLWTCTTWQMKNRLKAAEGPTRVSAPCGFGAFGGACGCWAFKL